MRVLIGLLLLLAPVPAFAQSEWTHCALEGDECFLGDGVTRQVRYGEPFNDRWTLPRTFTRAVKCDNATFGDPSPGTGKRCQWRAATLPVAVGPVLLTWTKPTTNTDGSPLTGAKEFLIYRAAGETGAFQQVYTTGDVATLALNAEPVGVQCYKLATRVGTSVSDLSNAACKLVRAPAPSDGRIEAPTDGAIESR